MAALHRELIGIGVFLLLLVGFSAWVALWDARKRRETIQRLQAELEARLPPGLSRYSAGRHELYAGAVHDAWIVIEAHLVRDTRVGLRLEVSTHAAVPGTGGLALHAVIRRADAQGGAGPGWSEAPNGFFVARRRGMDLATQRALMSRLSTATLGQLRDRQSFPNGIALLSRWASTSFGDAVASALSGGVPSRAAGVWLGTTLRDHDALRSQLEALAAAARSVAHDLGGGAHATAAVTSSTP